MFAIVATADDTTVTITPSPMADLRGFLWTNAITLQAGETYQTGDSCNPGDDVTGTWITSDKPVAVFAGANLAEVPDDSAPAANPLAQELLPVDMWGTQALALSLAGRTGGDSYRVLAAYTNTVVWTNGMVAGTNQAGQFLDLLIDGPVEFKGSQPIQVAQFANGVYFDHPPFDRGDPCEILLPPAGHYLVTNTVFTLPATALRETLTRTS
ncbi:MAG: IgGFc-binding protein [Limisphaerales bacterium]